jgi:hypothetical protein
VMTRRRLGWLVGAGCLYLAGLGFLSGVVVERVRFDRQRATVHSLSATQERLHTRLMDLERHPESPGSRGDR